MTDNLYDILGIPTSASAEDIRKAYRKLAIQYHPDRNQDPSANEKFQKITQAYELLGNEERRKLYDQYGDLALNPNFQGFEQDLSDHIDPSRFSDFFANFRGFGGGGHGTQSYRGSDGYTDTTANGTNSTNGSSGARSAGRSNGGYEYWDPSTSAYEAYDFGTGRSTRNTQQNKQQETYSFEKGSDLHTTISISLLESIYGCTKQVRISRQSRWIRGSNAGLTQEIVSIDVPANSDTGDEIYIRGKGNYGQGGGEAGNLVATVEIQDHPFLQKVGCDLFLQVPLTIQESMLGAKVEVPTLSGIIRVPIPANVRPGQKLRLKNRGLQKANGGQGDLYLVLRPQFPEGNTEKLQQIAADLERFYPPGGVRHDFRLE